MLLRIHQEVEINAPAALVWESLLEQIGPGFDKPPEGVPTPMKLEAWPGGRWYRDLGNNTGHFWAHVQVIKPPTLLELVGPMFMSYPVASHVQYRLTEKGRTTKLSVTHRAIGDILPDHRTGANMGWQHIVNRIKARAER
jgi:uncharacterized protein YndB with AHSA1/START domain